MNTPRRLEPDPLGEYLTWGECRDGLPFLQSVTDLAALRRVNKPRQAGDGPRRPLFAYLKWTTWHSFRISCWVAVAVAVAVGASGNLQELVSQHQGKSLVYAHPDAELAVVREVFSE